MPFSNKQIITVENLGKCYKIGYRESYKTLSDTLSNSIKFSFLKEKITRKNKFFWALNNISFTVEEGDIFGVIGRNGAGKSTLLKILSRITYPTTGKITIHGRVGSLLEVGTGFHPELTGRENIYLSGSILGMSKNEIHQNFDQIVKFSEIEDFIDTPVKRYSSGMYVRLAFSVAAFLNSDILLIDEVLAVGDSKFQKKSMGRMKSITNEGRTILFVSHNIGAISNLCNSGLLLKSGNLDAIGDISHVISKYTNDHEIVNTELLWNKEKAPGDNYIKLHSVKILVDGKSCYNVSISKDVFIEICYWNLKKNLSITVSIHLLDKNGYPVFASGIDNEETSTFGLFKTTVKIPKNFLNDGIYFVTIILLTNVTNIHIYENEIVTFNIVDTGELRENYSGAILGIIRPQLEWKTDLLEKGLES